MKLQIADVQKKKTKRYQERMRQISLSRLQPDQIERKSDHEFKKFIVFGENE